MDFQQTRLWKNTLGQEQQDAFSGHRLRLRNALLGMRTNVGQLITHIPSDCRDLTVHDVTHLDALWFSAEEICGHNWELNPAEAFVFGAAVLIHDAGLTSIAYSGGKEALKATKTWADLSASMLAAKEGGKENSFELSPDDEASILFAVLRELHAEQAVNLCSQSWPALSGEVFLLEDSELREAYGEIIGQIASSHHWNAERVRTELPTHQGGSPFLPTWSINAAKLACMLRCADAAQVDRIRAPILLHGASQPSGYSNLHWTAQGKLNRPTLKDDAIFFSSSSAFSDDQADAWWIAFELASILDKELRESNAILTDIGTKTFAAQRVAGAGSPTSFSQYVKTKDWRPIDASIRVSDPLKLARTLGGRNLYGFARFVPFRELLQNSADAIRARRQLESRGKNFGKINITIEENSRDSTTCLIHIDDNGIGMSERILTGTLVDFGKSLWSSSIIREEFPGLQASRIKHIGRFGIGFFSVFEIATEVLVSSKKYDAGQDAIRTLHFRDLISRPLLRHAKPQELPIDASTRVTLLVPKKVIDDDSSRMDEDHFFGYGIPEVSLRRRDSDRASSLQDVIKGMVSYLDIEVDFKNTRNGDNFTHTSDVNEKPAEKAIDEFPGLKQSKIGRYFQPEEKLRLLEGDDGQVYGRAALDIDMILAGSVNRIGPRSNISVGGIVAPYRTSELRIGEYSPIPFFGVVEGEAVRAARDVAKVTVPDHVIETWLVEQINILDHDILRISERMKLAAFLLGASGRDFGLPYAYSSGMHQSVSQVRESVKGISQILVPLTWRFDGWPEVLSYDSLRPEFFEAALSNEVFVLVGDSERLVDEEMARSLRKAGGGPLEKDMLLRKWTSGRAFVNLVEEAWQGDVSLSMSMHPIFSTGIVSLSGDRWVVRITRSQ